MSGLYLPSENDFDPSTDYFFEKFLTKERNYLHFDSPMNATHRMITEPLDENAPKHRFLPLLGYTDVARKIVRSGENKRTQ